MTKRKLLQKKKTPRRVVTSRAAVAPLPQGESAPADESAEPDEPEPEPDEARDLEDAEETAAIVGLGTEGTADPYDLAGSPEPGRARIHALGAEIGRLWGTHTAMPMSVAPVVNIMRMPIGILEFDFRTGGGLIIGRCNRLKGKKDTLKSTLCLRALRAAQLTCRHCKWRIAKDPETGRKNCRCPVIRYWVKNEEDYAWLPQEAAIRLFHGMLPDGAIDKDPRSDEPLAEPYYECDPPPHLVGKKGIKRRQIPLKPMSRCEPMRCVYVDTERTIDAVWARKNGVDPGLVLLIGAKWAEQCLEAVERTVLTREFDFAIIDSTSMMETREMLEERQAGDRGTPAGKQRLMGDFIKRIIAAQSEEGLAGRYSPTLLTTSHLTQKGIGYGKHPYLGATDGNIAEHGIAMDILMKADRFIFDKEKQKAIYGQFTFTIDKNHCGGMGSTKTSGAIKFWLIDTPDHPVGDSNDLDTVLSYARAFGEPFVSEGRGSSAKLVLHSPMIQGERKPFSTIAKCKTYLTENDGVYDDLRARVLNKLIEDRAQLSVVEAIEPEGVPVDG